MLHYHQKGVMLTLNFSSAELPYFQEGIAGLLLHLSETAKESPAREEMLYVLARLMRETVLSDAQQSAISDGLDKIGKLPEQAPLPTAA